MKLKKIIAGIAAAAVAVSAMAINAFAATFDGSHKMVDKSWWTQEAIVGTADGVGVENLIGNLDPATVTSITFKSDTAFFVGYKGTDLEWHQNTEAVTEITITDMLLIPDGDEEARLELMISKGDGVEYTISWTAEGEELAATDEGDAEAAEDETDAEAADDEDAGVTDEDLDESDDEDLDESDDEDFDEDTDDDADVDDTDDEDVDDGAFDEDTDDDADADAGDGNDAPAPADNGTSNAPATGNVAVASIAAVMAVAGAAALVSRKRK